MPAMSIMEVHPEGDPVMRELGKNLTELQDKRGYSLKYLERAVLRVLQDDGSPTHETIRQYHSGGGTASRANLGLIAALCVVYRVSMSEVSPELARRAPITSTRSCLNAKNRLAVGGPGGSIRSPSAVHER